MNPNKGDVGSGGGEISQLPLPAEKNETAAGKQVEKAAYNETAPVKQSVAPAAPSMPAVIPDANPVILPAAAQDDTTHPAQVSGRGPERIERQWIDRAKSIVEKTKDDPFKQKNEMSKVKAEYIKQRFNKTIKTDTGTA